MNYKKQYTSPLRETINGSFEPLWRRNARQDAEKFKAELVKSSVSRRKFLASAGAALLLEYVTQRRAVALTQASASGSAAASAVTGITNARTGSVYPYLPEALRAMQDGDTILLPAGRTYQYHGETRYYSHWANTNCYARYGRRNVYLGKASLSRGICGGDYGTIQGVGSANNGRALIAPSWGILAQDFRPTDTEMFFDPSTPAASFPLVNGRGTYTYVNPNYNFGQFAYFGLGYTGINIANNSLTGVSGSRPATVPAGTVITTWVGDENKAIFIAGGANPGWTLKNLELAYTAAGTANAIQQDASPPGGPYVGSVTIANCYIHDCKQGPGLGYSGIGDIPTFTRLFDTEIARNGGFDGQSHNIYVGHVGEFIMDNSYSHFTTGAWLVKTRAPLNILTYCQFRGERTDNNASNNDNAGIDIPNGGLTYFIGCIHQQSLNAGNQAINYAAEANFLGSSQGGSPNHIQELYVINGTIVGPANGVGHNVGKAPIKLNYLAVNQPPITKLSQINGGTLPGRQYWAAMTNTGESGGESAASPLKADIGSGSVYEELNVAANNLMRVAAPPQMTGTGAWNCYLNYGDPLMYSAPVPYPQPTTGGNYFFWDRGHTRAVFAFSPGGTTISAKGTLENGKNVITGVTELAGLASLWQLLSLTVYVDGVSTGLVVWDVNTGAGTLTLNGNYSGSGGAKSLTFGSWLSCGFTYQTPLGESVNASNSGIQYVAPPDPNWPWYDGSYTSHRGEPMQFSCFIQVEPGQKLVVNAPPSGPSWASGVNFWAQQLRFAGDFATGPDGRADAGFLAKTKLNSSPIRFGETWTSRGPLFHKAQQMQSILYRQNASPIPFGTDFTEPSTGLLNNNPNQNKLEWFRRGAANIDGLTMDCWYAIVPAGGLSGYQETIHLTSVPACIGSVSVWRGCVADPFDANFQMPVTGAKNAIPVNTAAGNVTVLAAFRSSIWNKVGTAGTGFTQVSSVVPLNVEYAAFASPQSALNVTQTGGALSDILIVDALAGSGSPPRLISTVNINAKGGRIDFTIPVANAGDVLYLFLGSGLASAVGRLHGPPPMGDAVGISTLCVIKNSIAVNYDSRYTGPSLACNGGTADSMGTVNVGVINPVYGDKVPSKYVTEVNNLKVNPFDGRTFGSPSYATVFADPNQASYDYRLAPGSPALNAAADSGRSLHGKDLVPQYQSSWHGLPTEATPIPAKDARADIGGDKIGSIGALA
jgi:hypothetical protein